MTVLLYTTLGCHLCDRASELVAMVKPGLVLTPVDIAEDDALIEQYGERIPVLVCEGRELAWPFGVLDVQQFLS